AQKGDLKKLELFLSQSEWEEVQKLRDLTAHENPSGSLKQLFMLSVRLMLKKKNPLEKHSKKARVEVINDPAKKTRAKAVAVSHSPTNDDSIRAPEKQHQSALPTSATVATSAATPVSSRQSTGQTEKRSRYIPAPMKRAVWTRD